MKLLGTRPSNLHIRPNMVNFVEEDEQGLHFHYAINEPWTLYLGERLIYRKKAKMNVIEKAWERDFYSLLELRICLDAYMALQSRKNFDLMVNGTIVSLRHFEVVFLRQEIESVVRQMKEEVGKWEIRPPEQRVPLEHLYAVS